MSKESPADETVSAEPTARLEYVDVVTGAPAPASERGTLSTGRVVADIDGETVEIDEEDLLGPGTDSDPRKRRYRFDHDSPENYTGQAKAKKAARASKKAPRKQASKVGLRRTFDSATKAAAQFYENNADYFDHVHDPWDGLRDWMDGIEVRVGRSAKHRKLSQTSAGKRILQQKHAAAAIRGALAYLFRKAKGRKWEDIPWDQVDRLGEALERYYEAPTSGSGQPTIYWQPFAGTVRAEDLDAMTPEQREAVRVQEATREIGEQLEDLREAYSRAKGCLPSDVRRVITRRMAEWSRWVQDPTMIPSYACEPDPKTAGYLCNYPSVAGELAELKRSCEDAYDPDWAAAQSKQGAAGFPDTRHGEDELPRKEVASAKACCSSRTSKPATAKEPPRSRRKRSAIKRPRQKAAERRVRRLQCSAAAAKHEAETIDTQPYRDRVKATAAAIKEARRRIKEQERQLAAIVREAATVTRDKGTTPKERQSARQSVTKARCELRIAQSALRQRRRDHQRAQTELSRAIARVKRREAVADKRQRAVARARAEASALKPGNS
ncbi:MAG: hypothetical protein AAF799_48130 [Myxococcota bacterium]